MRQQPVPPPIRADKARSRRSPRPDRGAATPHLRERLLRAYQESSYRLLGSYFGRIPRRRLQHRLKQADIQAGPAVWLSMAAMTAMLGALVFTLAGGLYFMFLGVRLGWLASPIIGAAGGSLVLAMYPFVLGQRIGNRKAQIDKELPFSLSELSVLAAIGLSPVEMVRRMAGRDRDPAMTREFGKVLFKATIQSKDLISALSETANECPSELLRETLYDLGNMIHQGGNLADYLQNRAQEVLEAKRTRQRAFIEKLGGFGDMYVTVVLMSLIFLGMGAFMMDAFGRTAGPLAASALLSLLAYGILPFLMFMIGLMLNSAHQRVG